MTTFLAVDLAERVCTVALGGDEVDINSPGWPVRMPLGRMHSWLVATEDAGWHGQAQLARDPESQPRVSSAMLRLPMPRNIHASLDKLSRCVTRWGIQATDAVLVVLSEVGRDWACRMAQSLGCRQVCIPRYRYMISPRGVVPAGILREYSHQMTPTCNEQQGRLLPFSLRQQADAVLDEQQVDAVLDWQKLREAFVDLLERAADDVQAAKFEQDDSVVDRYAELRWAGGRLAVVVPVESLSDPQWLLNTLREATRELGEPEPSDASVEVLSLHLRCAVELPEMFPMPIAASDGQIERAITSATDAPTDGPGYERSLLLSGDNGRGPGTIVESGLAIPIADGWSWSINDMGQLICRMA